MDTKWIAGAFGIILVYYFFQQLIGRTPAEEAVGFLKGMSGSVKNLKQKKIEKNNNRKVLNTEYTERK